ncbi:MAG: hypothetical protein QXX08_10985 [Candidatus Bathyarchaeia archaeon]
MFSGNLRLKRHNVGSRLELAENLEPFGVGKKLGRSDADGRSPT